MDEKITFGKKLKEAREANEIIQRDLADMLGLNHWNISDMEVGKTLPSRQLFLKICNLLNRTDDWFFPNGVPQLQEERPKSKERRKRAGDFKGYRKINEDENNINFDIENEINNSVKKDSDNDMYENLKAIADEIPQLKSILENIILAVNNYRTGTGESILDITVAFADDSRDDFMHRRISKRNREEISK